MRSAIEKSSGVKAETCTVSMGSEEKAVEPAEARYTPSVCGGTSARKDGRSLIVAGERRPAVSAQSSESYGLLSSSVMNPSTTAEFAPVG